MTKEPRGIENSWYAKGVPSTPLAHEAVIQAVAEGRTLAEGAARARVSLNTVKSWITRGRREDIGIYADFARAIEAARAARGGRRGRAARVPQTPVSETPIAPVPMSPEEFRRCLEGAVRAGSPPAMKLWADRFLVAEEPERPTSAITRLAERRPPGDGAA